MDRPRPRLQISVAGMLAVVACIAVNVWLFRVGILWGLLAVNVTKHVLIAYLCQILGVDKRLPEPPPSLTASPIVRGAAAAPGAIIPPTAP